MPLPTGYVHPLAVTTKRGRKRNMSGIRHNSFPNVVTADPDGYVTTLAGPNTTTITPTLNGVLVTGGVGKPDFARNVVVVVTHASAVVAESGVITGTDINGKVITEAWSVTAGGTSKTFTGAKAFKTVTSVTITAASDASANSNTVGTGKVLGLDCPCSSVMVVAEHQDGALVTAGVLVAASSAAAADSFGTYTPNGTPNGALDFDIWFVTDDPHTAD